MSLLYSPKRERRKHVCKDEANQNVDLYVPDMFDSAESVLCLPVDPTIQADQQ